MCARRIFTPLTALLLSLALGAGSPGQARQERIAFVNVTIVPMDQERVLPGQTVVVEGKRIAQTGPASSIKLPASTLKIDGRGDFLMPGLADMHVHLIRSLDAVKSQASSAAQPASHTIPPLSASDDHERENHALGLLFVSNGITSVRNMWGDSVERADMGRLTALVESMRTANIWNCPTVVLVKNIANDAEFQRNISLVPPSLVARYRRGMPQWHAHPEVTQRVYDLYLAIVHALREGGARLLLGTDAPKPTVLPGFSLHAELQSFVQAGLTPYQALRAGTSDAAIFLHQEAEFGTISSGLRADLLLLKANPLDDVANIDKRVGVMVAGRWFTEAELQQRLLALRPGRSRATM